MEKKCEQCESEAFCDKCFTCFDCLEQDEQAASKRIAELESALAHERRKCEALADATRAAMNDIREHLQVAKYNLRGEINTGEVIERPNPPMLIHEAGISCSERVMEKCRKALVLGQNEQADEQAKED